MRVLNVPFDLFKLNHLGAMRPCLITFFFFFNDAAVIWFSPGNAKNAIILADVRASRCCVVAVISPAAVAAVGSHCRRRMGTEHGPTPRPWQPDSHNTSLLSGVDAVRSRPPRTNEQKNIRGGAHHLVVVVVWAQLYTGGGWNTSDDVDVGSLYY